MNKLLIGLFILGSFSSYALTLNCKQMDEQDNHQLMIENVGDSQFMGDKRIICQNKKDPEDQVGLLIRGIGIGLRYTKNENFKIKCRKVNSTDDLIYRNQGFFGGKFSVGLIGGASVGIFKSEKEDDLGTCYITGVSLKTIGIGFSAGAITFWKVD
ncbi:MAG: hypothetical protein N4A33_05635 [Bacteriovoracaceae bacterium]|jgi:hypothetical protein|nr:hypothetical protein [Bacteriovoracaceae bacterium]